MLIELLPHDDVGTLSLHAGEVGGSSQVLASVFGWLQTLIMVLGELSPLFYIAATQVLVLV